MQRRILGLVALEALLAAGGLWTIGRQVATAFLPSWQHLVAFTAVFAVLALLPRVQVEFRRHACWITPADCILLVAMFELGPLGFVLATMMAEVPAAIRYHRGWLKTTFNLTHMLGGYVAAALIVGLAHRIDPLDPLAWLVGVLALTAVAAWDTVSTAAVMSIAEGHRYREMVVALAPANGVSLVISALLGIAALVLFSQTVFGPLLFAPVFLILLVSTRGVSHQRAERLSFERLYEASSRLTRLVSLPDMLALIATEASQLLTGVAAICCTADADGSWTGQRVDDQRTAELSEAALAALREVTGGRRHGETVSADLPARARKLLPTCSSLVWATGGVGTATPVLLVVFRQLSADERQEHRAEVLDAFATHAAAVVANIGLHAEVQASLDQQVALNRQKSDFVAAVSHELRTPLAAMIGSVQTLRRLAERLPEDERERLLDMGLSQGVRLKGLIDDLLLVAAADHEGMRVDRVPIALPTLFAAVAEELGPLTGDRLEVQSPAADLGVLADEDKLRRILINLIDNARKYAPEGRIALQASKCDTQVRITVTDQGPGIRPEDRERVFERFVQLDQSSTRRQGGTGLGLSLCRQLAGRLDGTLVVEDGPAGGACFVLMLEAADPMVAATPSLPPADSAVRPRPLKAPAAAPSGGGRSIARKRPTGMTRPAGIPADGSDTAPAVTVAVEGAGE